MYPVAGVPRMLGTYSVRDYIPFTKCVPRYTPHRTFLGIHLPQGMANLSRYNTCMHVILVSPLWF